MKLAYVKPTMEVKGFGQFENVFTYCTKGNVNSGCVDVSGSGNDADKPDDWPESLTAAFSGGGSTGSGL